MRPREWGLHYGIRALLKTTSESFLSLCPMRTCGQEYWHELPCPPTGDLPNLRMEPVFLMSPALAGGFFTTVTTWEAHENPGSLQFIWSQRDRHE